MSDRQLAALHARARTLRARRMWLYKLIRMALHPFLTVCFRPHVSGLSHVPDRGGLLLTSNHRSFFDSFFQALVIDRPMHWMAKAELFERGWQRALLIRLGAFPVRRGQSDQLALDTARELLRAGEMVGIFPEGTRVRDRQPGQPHRGAARLAIEAGVPMLPMAIVGTERGALRRALWRSSERVRVSFGLAVWPPGDAHDDERIRTAADELTRRRVWPQIAQHVRQLEEHRRVAAAAGMTAAVSWTLLRRRRRG